MKTLTFFIFIVITSLGCSQPKVETKNEKPNILFIAVDDLNDWISPLDGYDGVITPNLDKLADESVTFTNAHCAAPACNPSRAAIMTGIAPYNSGVYFNPQPWRESELLKDVLTLPQYLSQNGYKVMGSGKIFHGGYEDSASWDYYWPSQSKSRPPDPQPKTKPLNGIPKTGNFDWGAIQNSKEEMSDWKVAEWTINELNKDHEKPFFLACGLFRPHLPWFVPQEYFDMYPLDEIVLPKVNVNDLEDLPIAAKKLARTKDHENVTKNGQWKHAVQAYLASITFVDECIGKVIKGLKNSKYAENTIVVLWSDHGWHLGEKLSWRKFTLWEEATRNVLMFRIPDNNQNGLKTNTPVNLLDIYPTIIEACGLEAKAAIDGKSFYPALKDVNNAITNPTITTYGKGNHSIRSKYYRFTKYADGSEEFYDHKNDKMEWINLADKPEYDSIKTRLSKYFPNTDAEYSPFEKGKERN